MKPTRTDWLVVVTDDEHGDEHFYGPYTIKQRDAVIARAQRWVDRQPLDPDLDIPQWSVGYRRIRRWDSSDD